jgi:hypothetical protein
MDKEPPNGAFSTCEFTFIWLALILASLDLDRVRGDDTDGDLLSTATLKLNRSRDALATSTLSFL